MTYEQRVAERLNGFDPITILTIIGTIVSIVTNCWRVSYSDTDEALCDLRTMGPKRATRKLRRLIKRNYPEMHESQRKQLADSMYLELEDDDAVKLMESQPVIALSPDDLQELESEDE